MITLPKTPSFRLNDKIALVTGGSSGIGQACAAALAEYGAHVVIAARGQDRIAETVEAIHNAGGSAEGVELDQSNIEAIKKLSEDKTFDIIVNSAGLARHAPALTTQVEDYDAVMAVNLRSAHFLSVYAAEKMIAAGKAGSIIHISSQMGHIGGLDRSVYCASKHGLEGMVKTMAIEWGAHNIRINTICPTFIRTPLTEQTFSRPERVKWIEEKIKLNRIGEVEDIMGTVVFLASDASALITGTHILVDGGWTAG